MVFFCNKESGGGEWRDAGLKKEEKICRYKGITRRDGHKNEMYSGW